jgi:hypothetical protein
MHATAVSPPVRGSSSTIEHLACPINGFHVAHDMAKVGDVVRHNLPLIGWFQPGFVNLITKFYAISLATMPMKC